MHELKNFNDQLFKNVISNPTEQELRNLAKPMEKTTEFNSASYVTEVRNRSAKNTYIVDEIEVGVDQKEISQEDADKILQKGRTNKYDLAISVDCSDLKRLVGGKEYFETAKRTIEIDHHSVNSMFADFNYVDPVAPACCQVLIGMFEYFGIDIDKELGTCLLTGIITDTGGFQYSSVTSDTFEFAAQLLRKGVNISKICQEVLRTKTKAHCQLEKLIYERLEFIENGKIAITYLTLKDYAEYSNDMGDDEGLVESIRDIEGVEVAVLLKEKENGGFKISMRSKDNVNVSDICLLLGGGGHPRAAGCFITGDVSQAKTKVINTIKQQINK